MSVRRGSAASAAIACIAAALVISLGCATPGIAGIGERLRAPVSVWDACAQSGRGFELYIRIEAPRLVDIASRVSNGEAVGGGEIVTYGCDGEVQKTLKIDPDILKALLREGRSGEPPSTETP